MVTLLARTRKRVGTASVYGGCLCSCNGRGRGLFGVRNHDATLAQRYLGPLALTGFFCNGEIGPVHNRSFVHGYSASLALFVAR
jgi:small ligand-binding sensory domain FIST